MSAAVDDVHHRHGQSVGVAAADVFVEGEVEIVGSSLGNGQRYAEDGVGAEVRFGVGAVELEHLLIDGDLVEGAHSFESLGDGAVYVGNSLENAFTHVAALVAVAELESFVDAGGGTRGNGSAATRTAFEDYVNFNSGIAAGVEHFTADDFFNFHNSLNMK